MEDIPAGVARHFLASAADFYPGMIPEAGREIHHVLGHHDFRPGGTRLPCTMTCRTEAPHEEGLRGVRLAIIEPGPLGPLD